MIKTLLDLLKGEAQLQTQIQTPCLLIKGVTVNNYITLCRLPATNFMSKLYWAQSSTDTVILIVLFRKGGLNLVGDNFLEELPLDLAML